MSRNIKILIIGLVVLGIIAFGFLYFYKPTSQTNTTETGTNFLSNLLSFGKSKILGTPSTPADISGLNTEDTDAGTPAPERLTKVSSMPIAGFGIFQKERFVELPTVIPATDSVNPPQATNTPEITTTSSSTTENTTPPTDSKQKTTTTKTAKTATPKKETKPTAPPTEFIPSIRYVARADGNIYQTFADQIDERKFTGNVIPEVYDAYFSNKGDSVTMRYLNDDDKTIETFMGLLPKETLGADTTVNEIKGSFLPENILNISVSPDNLKLFYLFNLKDNEASIGITTDSTGNKKVQVFDSPFTEWLSWWPNNRMITLNTKPSSNVPGYMYSIDPENKALNKILGNINGLTTLTSPSGKLVLYSSNNLNLNIYNVDTKTSTSLGIRTLPEKCVWSKLSDFVYCAVPKSINGTNYPDTWYQGEVSFNDQIWLINVLDGTTGLISDPENEKGESVDGIKLALDENENYLFFVNKKDSYLWELSL